MVWLDTHIPRLGLAHSKNQYVLSNQKNCGKRLQACNKLELSNNE